MPKTYLFTVFNWFVAALALIATPKGGLTPFMVFVAFFIFGQITFLLERLTYMVNDK